MTNKELNTEAKTLLRQYRNIPSIDKSREMLVARYGDITFAEIRRAAAQLWLNGGEDAPENTNVQVECRDSQGYKRIIHGTKRVFSGVGVVPSMSDTEIADILLRHFGLPQNIQKAQKNLVETFGLQWYNDLYREVITLYKKDRKRYTKTVAKREALKASARAAINKPGARGAFGRMAADHSIKRGNPNQKGNGKVILTAMGHKR